MVISQEAQDLRQNLTHLQTNSLRISLLPVSVIGYVWVALSVWPVTSASMPTGSWVGGVLLVATVIISYLLHNRQLYLASYLLVWGGICVIAIAMITFQELVLAYLLILPINYASMLLGQKSILPVTTVSCLLTLGIGKVYLGYSWFAGDVLLPTMVISLSSVAFLFSARNLYVALAWVWSGYARAREQELVARERQAELRRALKALDEASYRLERTNYMLALARDQAEESRRLKQQFAQTISHELRTPLNLIVGFSELMIHSPEYYGVPLPPSYARDLSIVHRNASHLQTLVSDVLDLARIEAAQISLTPEEVEPASLVDEAVETSRSLVEARGLALRTEIEPGLPRLRLDKTRIRQVLFNLINNAARFTDQGGVTVSVKPQEKEVLFAVSDTGVGIASEEIPWIFEEFHQIDSTTRRHEGAGLGLAISKRFVELHGGSIWVESQVGQGSAFFFSLPVNWPKATQTSVLFQGETRDPDGLDRDTERTLLLVTASPSAAALLTRYVRGCRSVIVHDLIQAQRLAQQLMPQAVVIDIACEDLSSIAVDELAHTWGLPRTPFLVCPLPGEEPIRQRLAVDGYLIKPVSRQNLWDTLRRFGEDVDRVLVIDDDRDFVRMLRRMLDSPVRRYRVFGAHSGQEGLEMLDLHDFDLVLLDLVLPDMNGVQVIQRVRSAPVGQHLPIIIVSAQDEMDHLEALQGAVSIAKAEGLMPGEIVWWVQQALETAAHLWPSSSGNNGGSAKNEGWER